jgi:hypothetical protein
MERYFGHWSNYESMINDFFERDYITKARKPLPPEFPSEDEILFASYGGGMYEGDAVVLYRKDGKLYEVQGSHCSCYGLENQWEPEETSIAALALRKRKDDEYPHAYHFLDEHEDTAVAAYWALVDSLK